MNGDAARRFRVAVAILLMATLSACESVTFTSTRWEAVQKELNRRYELWRAARPANYQYKFDRVCECREDLLREVIVEVRDTTVVAATYTDSSTAVPDSSLKYYFSVEGLFTQIQIAINSLADSLYVEYDPTLHYPRVIVGDLNIFLADDELSLYASELVAKQD
ncbi:MAG TPA: DUF6174 domain-containing protein [Gemmatimonadales bacterium]|nr:DUF6174 domain-containing protein [Gemmatimonadales bacterium]